MIETSRLKLIPPSLDHQPQLFNAIQESQVELRQFLPWVDDALCEKSSIEQTEKAIENYQNFTEELRFSLVDKENDMLIGVLVLKIRDASVPCFEIGYWLRSSCTGNGYITEAVNRMQQYAFDDLGANRVEIRVPDINFKSRAVAERCGFFLEGLHIYDHRLPNGELGDTAVYSKTKKG